MLVSAATLSISTVVRSLSHYSSLLLFVFSFFLLSTTAIIIIINSIILALMMDDDRTDGTFHRVCESGHTRDSSTETNFSAARSIHRTMASLTEKLSTSKQTKEEKEEWNKLRSKKSYSDIFVKTNATEEEVKKIAQMRERIGSDVLENPPLSLQEENVSDDKMIRFLRGYKNSVDEAVEAFNRMLAYRKENNIDRNRQMIIDHDYECPNGYPKYKPIREAIARGMRECYSFDKFGNLVTVTSVGDLDMKKVLRLQLQELYLDYIHTLDEWYNIKLYRLSKERNACVGRHDIINVTTFGYFQFDRPCYKFLQEVFDGNQHYPESCVRITSLGNGWLAMMAWRIMSPFIPARTKEKLRAVGTDFMPVLLESMEIDQIPAYWGGLKNDTAFDKLFAKDEHGSTTANIGRRDCHSVKLNVNNAGSKVEWFTSIKYYTINFEVTFEEFTDNMTLGETAQAGKVITTCTLNADNAQEKETKGTFICEKAGTIVFKWDNTHSMFRSKDITYRIGLARQSEADRK